MNKIESVKAHVNENRQIKDNYYLLELETEAPIPKMFPGAFVMLSFPGRLDPLLPRPMGLFQVLEESGKSCRFNIGYVVIGKGTRLMSELTKGNVLGCVGPLGNGWKMDLLNSAEKVILVAGGIGITPLYIPAMELAGKKDVTLLFGGAGANDLVFTDKFEKLGIDIKLYTEDGSQGSKGFVTKGLADEITDNSAILACGPEGMLRAVSDIALQKGIDPQLSFDKRMACGFGVCLGCNIAIKEEDGVYQRRVCKEGPVFFGGEVVW
ncbi:MAG: dihydroorotate dehydrogenase electron transfer subunit [Acidobacteria bacterium]|nr:dihydroorotate dehydrogenase electron transfer subunit [Acidobacteriota bacterium]